MLINGMYTTGTIVMNIYALMNANTYDVKDACGHAPEYG